MSFSQTLVHQIGHSLGLSHSNVYDSIMFPFIKTFNASSPVTFHREDVKAIETLYGEKRGRTDLTSAQVAAGEIYCSFLSQHTFLAETARERNLCSDASIDTIFRTVDGNTYVFQGDKVTKCLSSPHICLFSVLASHQPRYSRRRRISKEVNRDREHPDKYFFEG